MSKIVCVAEAPQSRVVSEEMVKWYMEANGIQPEARAGSIGTLVMMAEGKGQLDEKLGEAFPEMKALYADSKRRAELGDTVTLPAIDDMQLETLADEGKVKRV